MGDYWSGMASRATLPVNVTIETGKTATRGSRSLASGGIPVAAVGAAPLCSGPDGRRLCRRSTHTRREEISYLTIMNRRDFLKYPIAAAAMTMMARGADRNADVERTTKGFRIGANKDRYEEELLIMGGRFDLKVAGRDTGGDLCIYDTFRDSKGGPTLHRHYAQDEWFYVIKGDFIVQVGDEKSNLGPGDSAFAPRRIPHSFANIGEGEGQMLILFQPAGSMEDFFQQMARFGKDVSVGQASAVKQLFAQHGMEVVGPPLTF
jgi:mannose-6-phosphate isomerase-like protein (cupin superfamily)